MHDETQCTLIKLKCCYEIINRILHRLHEEPFKKNWFFCFFKSGTVVEVERQDEHQQTADMAERTELSCDS